ncbi:MAG: hypothetical protein LBP19_09375 [Treponema sp.]|nr:hypothetical protein [Treponema sp.]
MRQFGLKLLRHYIWLEGNAGYFVQTSDGIVINSKCSLPISGIKDDYLQADSFKNKNEFDTLTEEIRQLSYSLGGKLESLNEMFGIRTITYGFILDEYKITITVYSYLDSHEHDGGYGMVEFDVSLNK